MANRTTQGTKVTKDRTSQGTKVTKPKKEGTSANNYPSYSNWGGGGSGSGSGYSGKTPEELQKETQAQINNAGDNYNQRAKDLGKQGKAALKDIERGIKANDALFKEQQRQIETSIQWQPNQQKEQSTLAALRNRMGNAAYGSGIVDLIEGMSRVDDMNDVQLIETDKQNRNAAYNNWYQANESLLSDYNKQVNAINDEFSKLYSQYFSALSNINPLLASKKNIDKAAGNATYLANSKDSNLYKKMQEAKGVYTGAKGYLANNKNMFVSELSGDPNDPAVRKSKREASRAMRDYSLIKNNVQKFQKDYQRARNLYNKTLKAAKKRVSVGKGTDKYYLPNISLKPSSSLQAMLTPKKSAKAYSDYNRGYVRPGNAVRKAEKIPNTGGYNTENTGFLDSLRKYQRRV